MSTHDYEIVNQTALAARDDINDALQALASNNSSESEPSSPYEKMWWYDTSVNILKSYKGDGTWISVGRFNQTTNAFEILDDTKVVTTSGTEVGILTDQATGTWTTGTGTTDSLVSPAKVKAAVEALGYTQPTGNGDVGTYKFLVRNGAAVVAGSSYSGGDLLDSGIRAVQSLTTLNSAYNASATGLARGASYQSGTWQAMGSVPTGTTYGRGTLFLRIS